MKKILLISVIALLTISCGIRKQVSIMQYRPSYEGDVTVLAEGQQVPDGAVFLGTVHVGEGGMTLSCGYEKMMKACIAQTKRMGGNCLLVIKHGEPNFWTSCHSFKVNVFWVEPEK